MINNSLERDDKPTFKERLFGVPSDNIISKRKYQLYLIQIITSIIILIGATIFYTYTAFDNRSVITTTQYEEKIMLPEIKINISNIYNQTYPIFVYLFNIMDDKGNFLLNCSTYFTIEKSEFGCNINKFGDSIEIYEASITIYPKSQYLNLLASTNLNVFYVLERTWLDVYFPANVTTTINGMEYYSTTRQSLNIGLSKTVKVDQYGNQIDFYKTRISSSKAPVEVYQGIGYSEFISYSFLYYTNAVVTESTQTNFDLYLEILTSIGSLISTVAVGCAIAFGLVTKFYIRDKGSWLDDDIHQTILYHADQLNKENIQLNKFNINDFQNDR